MPNEPSLSELTYTPNPATAAGDRVVVSDNSQGIQDLIGAAQQKAHYDWAKYQDYQSRLGDAFKNLQVDYADINPKHRDDLLKMQGDFYSEISKDPSALANPQKNPQQYANIMNKYGQLKSAISQSKQQYAYATAQEKYMYDHPELLTDENKKITSSLHNQPLGQFNPTELQLPPVIDFAALSKPALERSLVKTPVNQQLMVDEIVDGKPTGKKIYTGEILTGNISKHDKDTYENFGKGLFDSNQAIGKYNQPIQDVNKRMYDSLDDTHKIAIEQEAKKAGMKPEELFFAKTWQSYYDPTEDRSDLKPTKDASFVSPLDLKKLAIDQENADTQRGRLGLQKQYQQWKMSDPKTATDIQTIYDGILRDGLTTKDIKQTQSGTVIGKTDRIELDKIPEGYQNISGIVSVKNKKTGQSKLEVGKLQPLIDKVTKKPYWAVKYYDPTDGEHIDTNSDFIKQKYAEVKKANPKAFSNIDDFFKAAVQKGLVMAQFVGANGTANINSLAQSVKATNAALTTKGEENIFGGNETEGQVYQSAAGSSSTTPTTAPQ